MARRNIFQPPPPPSGDPGPAPQRFPATGAMTGMKSSLRDLSSNAVREIDPALIEDDGPRDRLSIADADVRDLAESIKAHGQQVPIMVRPLPDGSGRYRIVYGRRRLQALKLVGLPAKALIRTLTDAQAILAQGQENSLRLDPSFIEKALFVTELADAGYEPGVILDALAIDKPMLSRMTKVARTIPPGVVRRIGPAHGIGRRRWEELADLVRDAGLDLETLAGNLGPDTESLASDDRFGRLHQAALRQQKPEVGEEPPALLVTAPDGATIAEIKAGSRSLTLRFPRQAAPAFHDWLKQNAEAEIQRLYAAWRSDDPTN